MSRQKVIANSLLYSLSLLMLVPHVGIFVNLILSHISCTGVLSLNLVIIAALSLGSLVFLLICFIIWQTLRYKMHINMEHEELVRHKKKKNVDDLDHNMESKCSS